MRATVHQLPELLPDLDWITDPGRVGRLSQDFSWFSPVLKAQLGEKRADLVVRPRSEEEIRRVVAQCAIHAIPITLRGSGTGNYGQCIPLQGGLVIDLTGFNALCWIQGDVARAQAGIRLSDLDTLLRPHGRELRWLPTTYRSATLGGLFGGGFGGAGSINYGPLAAPGNILGLKVMTVAAEPQVHELRGREAMLLHHTYGTNGIVLELEIALAPAIEWTEAVVTFTAFERGLDFAYHLGIAPGLTKKEVGFFATPVGGYFTSMPEAFPPDRHAVLTLVAPYSEPAMRQLAADFDGQITHCQTAEEVRASKKTLVELAWNHTTLMALKVDKNLTYIQSRFDPVRCREQARALETALSGEVLTHLEFLRGMDGQYTCSGLQLIRYSTEERLNQIMQIFRDHGVHINNPHVYMLEDGKQTQLDPGILRLKTAFDPQGLLNPGKLRSWPSAKGVNAPAA